MKSPTLIAILGLIAALSEVARGADTAKLEPHAMLRFEFSDLTDSDK